MALRNNFMLAVLFALAAVCAFASIWFGKGEKREIPFVECGFALATTIVLSLLVRGIVEPNEASAVQIGIGLGSLATLAACAAQKFGAEGPFGLAMASIVSTALLMYEGHGRSMACLGAAVGAGVFAAFASSKLVSLTAIVTASVCLFQELCQVQNAAPALQFAAPIVIAGSTLIATIGTATSKTPNVAKLWPVIGCVLSVLLASLAAKTYLGLSADWIGLAAAPVAALAVVWLQSNDSGKTLFSLALSTVIWICLATVGFGVDRGIGIGFCLLLVSAYLAGMGDQRSLVSAGPLLALTLHRVFRHLHPEVASAIDIGQHYALIGFALGALLPLLPVEWSKLHERLSNLLASTATLVWVIVIVASPALIALFLAPKGLLGFVTGLGFVGFFASTQRDPKPAALALASSVGALAILGYNWVEPFADLERAQKIHWFLAAMIAFGVVAAILAGASALAPKTPLEVQPA